MALDRRTARERIVQAANAHILRVHLRHSYMPRLISGRQIQRAVCIARRHQLVRPGVLAAAGYREVER